LLSRLPDEFAELRVRALILIAALTALAGPAFADDVLPASTGGMGRAFGMDGDSFDRPINPTTRDRDDNRDILNGRIELEGTLVGGLQDYVNGYATTADMFGGDNAVIVDTTQINNGDSADAGHGDN